MPEDNLAPLVTPHGHLVLASAPKAPALDTALRARLEDAFARGAGHGLLQLGAGEVGVALPPVFAYLARARNRAVLLEKWKPCAFQRTWTPISA